MELFLTVVRKIGIAVLIVDNGVVLFALLPAEIILISAGSFFVPCGVDVVCSAAHLNKDIVTENTLTTHTNMRGARTRELWTPEGASDTRWPAWREEGSLATLRQ